MNDGKRVVFTLDGERYGLPVGAVQQILRALPLTRIPNSPPEVLGVFDLRGETLPTLDTRALLGLPKGEHAFFVVVIAHGELVALAVDAVDSIEEYAENEIEETGEWCEHGTKSLVGRKGGSLTVLLDPHSLVTNVRRTHDEADALAA